MKLKNKLIPLAALATAASAIVPLTISCSSDAIKTSDINSVDLSMPSFLPHDAVLSTPDTKGISETKWATDTYTSLIKVHPEYFVDDLRWGVYQNFLSAYTNSNFIASEGSKNTLLKYTTNIKSLKFGATNPTFSTTNIILPGQGQDQKNTYNTISFKMKIEFEIEVDTFDAANKFYRLGAVSSHKVIKASTDVEYKNMIFFAIPAARDNKLEIANEIDKLRGADIAPAYSSTLDVNKPGWFITISDLQSQQDLYTYDFDDWGISYDCDMEIEDTKTIGILSPTKTVDKYHLTDFVNNPTKLNNLVNKKSYWRNSSYKIATQYTNITSYNNFWAWFSQNPEQIVANTVLMDIVSYYYINTLNTPTLAKTASSVWGYGDIMSFIGEPSPTLTPVSATFGDSNIWDILDLYPGGGLSVVNSQAFMGDDPTLSLDYQRDSSGYAQKDPFTLLIPAGGHTGPLYIPSSSTDDEELFNNPIYRSLKSSIDSWLESPWLLPVPTSYTPGRSLIVNSEPGTIDGLTGKWYSIPMASQIAKAPWLTGDAGTIDTIAINDSAIGGGLGQPDKLKLSSRLYFCSDDNLFALKNSITKIMNDYYPDEIVDDTGIPAYQQVFNYLSYADTFIGEGPSDDYRSLFFTLPKGTKVKIDYLFNDPSGIPEEKVAFQDMPTDILEIRYDTGK